MRAACQQTLKDLGLAYLDLYLVHWPEAWLAGSTPEAPKADTEVTIQQTWWVQVVGWCRCWCVCSCGS